MMQSTSKRRLAIFDFDGTLCQRNSYHVLLRDRLRAGFPTSIGVGSGLLLRRLRLISSERLKNMVLAGFQKWSREQIGTIGNQLYENELRPYLRPAAINEMETRRAEGFSIIVASGAFDFLLRPFCTHFDIEAYDCTQVAFVGELCSGHLDGQEMRGAVKPRVLQARFRNDDIDWEGSYAYSDELSDLPLFNMVGHPYLINSPASAKVKYPHLNLVTW